MDKAQTDQGLEPPISPSRETTARCLRALDRLVEIGMKIAEATGKAAETPEQGVDYCQRYATVSRAVRLTVMLEDKLSRPREEPPRKGVQVEPADRARARMRVTMAMGAAACDGIETEEDPDAQRRFSEMVERLDRPDLAEMIETYPPEVAVARLCRMFGLPPEWERWLELGDAGLADLAVRLSDEAGPPADPPKPRPAPSRKPRAPDTG